MTRPSRRELGFRAAGVLGRALLRALFATVRTRSRGHEGYLSLRREGKHVIFVLWHGHLLPLLHHHRGEGIVVLVSDHTDGEYVVRIMEGLGFGTARGSSTRGATKGLRGLIRAARAGHDLGVTPDGPNGPARVLKPGALLAAASTGLAIIPVAAGASRGWRLSSWDGFLVPQPLSRVELHYGPPYWVEGGADEETLAAHARRLSAVLDALTRSVEEAVGGGLPVPRGEVS